jgi:hypothetical protein
LNFPKSGDFSVLKNILIKRARFDSCGSYIQELQEVVDTSFSNGTNERRSFQYVDGYRCHTIVDILIRRDAFREHLERIGNSGSRLNFICIIQVVLTNFGIVEEFVQEFVPIVATRVRIVFVRGV